MDQNSTIYRMWTLFNEKFREYGDEERFLSELSNFLKTVDEIGNQQELLDNWEGYVEDAWDEEQENFGGDAPSIHDPR